MKKEELRIGNLLVTPEGNFARMDALMMVEISQCEIAKNMGAFRYAPILITEELLIQLGFDWVDEADGWADKTHIIYPVKYDCWQIHPFCTNDKSFHKIIRYIHELQNLNYVLTGSELHTGGEGIKT